VSRTDASPQKVAKWLSLAPVAGKTIGYQVHDKDSMTIKDGILVNTLQCKSEADAGASRCAGPLGMKNDSGAQLTSVGMLGAVKRRDNRLTWGGAG
jgi:hypothetical protein